MMAFLQTAGLWLASCVVGYLLTYYYGLMIWDSPLGQLELFPGLISMVLLSAALPLAGWLWLAGKAEGAGTCHGWTTYAGLAAALVFIAVWIGNDLHTSAARCEMIGLAGPGMDGFKKFFCDSSSASMMFDRMLYGLMFVMSMGSAALLYAAIQVSQSLYQVRQRLGLWTHGLWALLVMLTLEMVCVMVISVGAGAVDSKLVPMFMVVVALAGMAILAAQLVAVWVLQVRSAYGYFKGAK